MRGGYTNTLKCARKMGLIANIDDEVNEAMKDENLKIEVMKNGEWVPIMEVEL